MKANYNIGDYVYLKTDIDQYQRLVTGYTVRMYGTIYILSLGSEETSHHELEISDEIDILLKSMN